MINMVSDIFGDISPEVWDAMRNAKTEWGAGDPNLVALCDRIKELTGKEDCILVPSCTMANLVAAMTHISSGDQVIVEEQAHTLWSEEWGIVYVARAYPKVVKGEKGILTPRQVAEAMDDSRFNHKPKTCLLWLENTHMGAGGVVYTVEQTEALCDVAHERGARVHLDGARIFNASVALGVPVKDLVRAVDSVSLNLNKALAALEGAMLCGTKDFIDAARIHIKRLGGNSMHQSGILAAGALVALRDENINRLAEDHRRAKEFAEKVNMLNGVSVDLATVQSNIVIADFKDSGMDSVTVLAKMKELGLGAYKKDATQIRFSFYNKVKDEDIDEAVSIIRRIL